MFAFGLGAFVHIFGRSCHRFLCVLLVLEMVSFLNSLVRL